MPVVKIETKAGWSPEPRPGKWVIEPLSYRIGVNMPYWLITCMEGVWEGVIQEHVAIKFSDSSARNLNTPDIEIQVEIGREWDVYKKRLKDFISMSIVQLLQEEYEGERHPSIDIQIMIMDWTGVSLDNNMRAINEW